MVRVTVQCVNSELSWSTYKNPVPTRPLANRDMVFVQDYVRVIGSDSKYFYTYNHSLDHPYFASRPGFVRAKVQYQGMVGVVGDGGKTRLTWLVNLDFGGLVPTSFMTGLLVSLMSYPIQILEDTEEYVKKKEGEVTEITKSSSAKGGCIHESDQGEEEEGAVEGVKGMALESKRESAVELKLKAELAEMKAEMARKDDELRKQGEVLRRKDDELRNKDEEHQIVLADRDKMKAEMMQKDEEHRIVLEEKDKEIIELRRRLPRV